MGKQESRQEEALENDEGVQDVVEGEGQRDMGWFGLKVGKLLQDIQIFSNRSRTYATGMRSCSSRRRLVLR